MNQWTQRWETQSYQMALFCNSFHLKTSYNGFSEWSETFQLERFCRYRLQTAVKFLRLLLLWRQKQYFLETDKRTPYLSIVCIHLLRNSLFCPTLSIVIWFNILQHSYTKYAEISLFYGTIFSLECLLDEGGHCSCGTRRKDWPEKTFTLMNKSFNLFLRLFQKTL